MQPNAEIVVPVPVHPLWTGDHWTVRDVLTALNKRMSPLVSFESEFSVPFWYRDNYVERNWWELRHLYRQLCVTFARGGNEGFYFSIDLVCPINEEREERIARPDKGCFAGFKLAGAKTCREDYEHAARIATLAQFLLTEHRDW